MKISLKLTLAFLLVSLASLTGLRILSYFIAQKLLTRQVLNRFALVASLKKSRLDGMPLGIGICASGGEILEFNEVLLQIIGYLGEEFKRIDLSDFEVKLKRKEGTLYSANPINLDQFVTVVKSIEDFQLTTVKLPPKSLME